MKKLFILLFLLVFALYPLCASTFWSSFMHSQDLGLSGNHTSSVKVFCNLDDSLTTERQILYKDGSAIAASDLMTHDIPYLPAFTADVLFNDSNPINIGFRVEDSNGDIYLAPVKFTGTAPSRNDLSHCVSDPIGDAAFTNTFLDLVSSRISFDESRLYIAIENNGGGFPTSQGFVFYSYIGVFSEPNNHDPNQTVFGLMYTVTQAGIISPGLYKITGTGLSDLVRIGGITIQTTSGTNILILSCLWSDLLADPDFNNWYVNSQSFGFMAMTQRITLTGGTVEADRTPGAVIYPVNEVYTPVINQIPVIYDPTPIAVLPDPYPGCLLAIRYQDENDDIPLQAKAIFDGIHEFDFIHMGESINGDMVFETSMDVTDIFFSNWHSLTYRFWYTNTDYVDTTVVNTGIHDPVTPLPALHCSIYPNPFAGDVNILVDNPKKQKVVISIFNIRGQCVKELYSGILEKGTTNLQWFNSHQFQATKASGVYFVGIKTDNLTLEKKIILVK